MSWNLILRALRFVTPVAFLVALAVQPSLAAGQDVAPEEAVMSTVGEYLATQLDGRIVVDGRRVCELAEMCGDRGHSKTWETRDVRLAYALARALGSGSQVGTTADALTCSGSSQCELRQNIDHVIAFGRVSVEGTAARVRVYRTSKVQGGHHRGNYTERDSTLFLEQDEDSGEWRVVDERMIRIT